MGYGIRTHDLASVDRAVPWRNDIDPSIYPVPKSAKAVEPLLII